MTKEKDIMWGLEKETFVLPLLKSKIKDVKKKEIHFNGFDSSNLHFLRSIFP